MNINIVGTALSAVGALLTVWSLWYARQQTRKVLNLERQEIISLWAFLDRIRTMIWEIQHIVDDRADVAAAEMSQSQRKFTERVFKGLCSEYVRVAEMIVKKTPGLTLDEVKEWRAIRRLKTDWQESQFVNLIMASGSLGLPEDVHRRKEVDLVISGADES
ncbi:MAG: hypothetical protein GY854_28060 [Deltaproteobacteria bacterium]|nr:hypothetical protein [Deltaproteobacteria bacterium]